MGNSLFASEGQNPFAIYNLESTFCQGAYQGITFDQHCQKVLQGYELTVDDESMHEFYYQEIKELYRLNQFAERIYILSAKNQWALEQAILKHSRPVTPVIQIHH